MVMYRVNGRQRRLTLGKYPAISLADARDLARTALTKAAKGIDAAGEKQGTRLATYTLFADATPRPDESLHLG